MMNAKYGIEIQTVGGKLQVKTPLHPEFVSHAKALNGRWDKDSRGWVFDVRDEPRVRSLCWEIFGTDGTDVPLVDVRYTLDDDGPEIYRLGRLIVSRRSRDSRAYLGPNVVVVEGGFPDTGGSVKNPRVAPRDGTVVEVRDVPANLAKKAVEDAPESFALVGGADAGRVAAVGEARRLIAEHGLTAEELGLS